MATSSSQQSAKQQLRSQIQTRLSALSEENIRTQSQTAQNTIISLSQYTQATRIGIYLSMPQNEAQTDSLVRDALTNGKKVFVPYLFPVGTEKPKSKVMDMLRLRDVQEYEELGKDSWGIPKLAREGREVRENGMGGLGLSLGSDGLEKGDWEVEELDVIIVPGVAFDGAMNRLGHGAGFYDRYLSRFCQGGRRKKPFLVGLCLAEQIFPPGQLVMHDWDWKVDAVAVGDGQLLTSKDVL